ncbi:MULTISPECIES: adenosylmethionine--8-amino-7-oxononanoate transaminase [unclassified Solwaraspora]|uniref:adenosylmethionine--8-amino-7-oxononanoate transaminase n=1 Tax=unclassified Solwaraspora TaxID=2627926 RepID=UPI00259B3BCB|nr:adenosylmethionine--8-amino-7-oxononanoate transaminase [Solwaraspora sp. WMMA2056]WJK39283.1 adenosylmethionine--8-amino-7-oxononanoate transaminase [Solwaraspora sp. WMMA2056]
MSAQRPVAGGWPPAQLLDIDRRHVWHPYAALPPAVAPYLVDSAAGVRLRLADGRELVDGMSSWWAAVHGYRHPVLDAAVTDQLGRMAHVMFGGLTHEPAVRLAHTLAQITPSGLEHVFLCDSGSVSVEVAIKMCLQYQLARGRPGKRRLATWRGGYHGDTFHPMSVCDPEGGMHHLWRGVLPAQVFVSAPPADFGAAPDEGYLAELVDGIARHADEIAAVIVEPVVQGTGGMRFHHPGYLRALREVTTAHDVLLIFDEIATGFGRTGAFFAAEHAGVTPDVLCVGKALTGGYLTLAAALCTPEVAAGISADGVLAHGPTFMGNPLACAVANASIDLLRAPVAADTAACGPGGAVTGPPAATGGPAAGPYWQHAVRRIEAGLRAGLAPVAALPGVRDVRVLGAIGVVQLDRPVDVAAATDAAVAEGVWLRPFRDLIYTMPPYLTDDDDVARIARAMAAAAAAVPRRG